ncbi:glycoside hydrolase domain-containing protein [Actinoplanes sp. NPDC051343]|uniref:glycoside hydrolase domain-containing protein n=1 Tax=Actinoplanes sp. NPDC051343 TaxID=3363906 RepID=UPI0037B7B8AF
MDAWVLKSQQWVNATYAGVSGYVAAPENGVTGWKTMYALTRALQHELGITSLSDTFGPTTLARVGALPGGGVSQQTTNQNLVNIVKAACWCKGYAGGDLDGRVTQQLNDALYDMQSNIGITPIYDPMVTPKLFKALLSMDAYVVVSGGTADINLIQRTMNAGYGGRRDFYYIPCDGIFSRDVQRALYLAIQFELGMTDDQATGNFGPATQAGLKAHPLSPGSTGVWVKIFSAAITFNRVRMDAADDTSVYSGFTDSYNADLAAAVRKFQEFSELPVNGNADFATWCQALVSTGDPDRPASGCDGITTVTDARAKALYAAGYRYVGRYLDERPSSKPLNKRIQPGELDTIFGNGLRVFPLSQYYGGEVGYFTWDQGFKDAQDAHDAAVGYGFATGTVVYFAVDYDATQDQIDSNIIPYFRGVVSGLADKGKKYIHGVYASRNVCAEVTRQTSARWSFVSGMSYGFSGNMGFPLPDNWAFNQVQTLTVGSGSGAIQVDKDIHRSSGDKAVGSVNQASSPLDKYVAYIERLYALAVQYNNSDPYHLANQLVMEYLRANAYDTAAFSALMGSIDHGFVDFVDNAGVDRINDLADPFYGIDLHVAHFGAACNGYYALSEPSETTTNGSDIGGWGGDWITFYGDWRNASESYASGSAYCAARLAKVDGAGTFKLRDLIEDVDAYNINKLVRGGANIGAAARSYYLGGGYLTRFRTFVDGRFGTIPHAKAAAKDMLTSDALANVVAYRTGLLESYSGTVLPPELLPDDSMDDFCQGFADMLQAKMAVEVQRAAALRAAGKI